MGYVIGTGEFPSTWFSMRALVVATIPPPPYPDPAVTFGAHNEEYPASTRFLKTIEGNGFIRISTPAVSGPFLRFVKGSPADPPDPPTPDFFSAENFAEPYPEQLTGRNVTTTSSTFTITAEAFTLAQEAGTGGEPPISVEWFTALT